MNEQAEAARSNLVYCVQQIFTYSHRRETQRSLRNFSRVISKLTLSHWIWKSAPQVTVRRLDRILCEYAFLLLLLQRLPVWVGTYPHFETSTYLSPARATGIRDPQSIRWS